MEQYKVHSGSIGIFVIIALAIIVAGGAFIYTTSDAPNPEELKESATDAAKVTANKGKEILEDGKDTVVGAGKDAVADAAADLTDEGKKLVGDAVKDAGQKMIDGDAGVMIDYSASELSEAQGDIVLDFAADWCPSCRAFEKDVQANLSDIPSDLTILRVDFDKELDLRKKYDVTLQHTFVQVDANGELISKWSGSPTLQAMVAKVQ